MDTWTGHRVRVHQQKCNFNEKDKYKPKETEERNRWTNTKTQTKYGEYEDKIFSSSETFQKYNAIANNLKYKGMRYFPFDVGTA